MEHSFPFVTFRPEEQNYLVRCSLAPRNFPESRVPFTFQWKLFCKWVNNHGYSLLFQVLLFILIAACQPDKDTNKTYNDVDCDNKEWNSAGSRPWDKRRAGGGGGGGPVIQTLR